MDSQLGRSSHQQASRFIRTLSFVILLTLVLAAPIAAQDGPSVLIRDVSIVNVIDGSIDENRSVLIQGDRIVTVAATDAVVAPDGAEVLNGEGRYLIPGLWDMHTHLLWSTDASEHAWTEMPEDADAWTLWNRYYGPFLDLLVANGVTGVREMWGNLSLARRVREEADTGERLAPRMVVAGHMMDGPPAPWPGMVVISTPAEARDAVDSLRAEGAAFIKVRNRLRPDVYRAVAERAQETGIPLAGHVPWLIPAVDASDAGQRSFEHLTGVVEGCSAAQNELIELNRLSLSAMNKGDRALADSVERRFFVRMLATQDDSLCRSLLRHLARNRTWLVPTLVLKRGVTQYLSDRQPGEETLLEYIHPDWRSAWLLENSPYGKKTEADYQQRRDLLERKEEIVRLAAEQAVPILAGTDTPNAFVFPGFSLHEELELMVAARLTPLEALQAATINPARFLAATDSLGSVEEGKLADLVLLEDNPLEDISHTQAIAAVVLDGELLQRHELDALLEGVAWAFTDDTE